MVRNAVLAALVALVAGEAPFPFLAPQNMRFKHELQANASFHKFQHYCFAFIYAVVGKGDAKALQTLPSLVGPLCRASQADCKLYTDSLLAAVQQKETKLEGQHPYSAWCEQVYNHEHPTATHTTTAMPEHHHSALQGERSKAPWTRDARKNRLRASGAGKAVAAALKNLGQAPEPVAKSPPAIEPTPKSATVAAAAPAAKARLPLQVAKNAGTTPTTTVQPQAAVAESAQEPAPTADAVVVSKEIKDMANDVGNFDHHFIADLTGHAIANTATRADEAATLGGAESAFDRASAAVEKLQHLGGHEHAHRHRHHSH